MFPPDLTSPFYPLATERLILRPWKAEDAEMLASLANDRRVSERLSRVPYPYTLEDAEKFISFSHETLKEGQGLHLAIARLKDHALLGGIGYDAELGYWLGHPFWRQGYGKEAAKTFVRFLFYVYRMQHILGSALETNLASQRIFEGMGFKKTGVKACTSLAYAGEKPGFTYALSKDDFTQRDKEQTKPIVWASAAILLNEKGQLLLTERPPDKSMAGMWEPPGGKLEANETPEDALVRELKEEVGINVCAEKLESLMFVSYPYETYHLVLTCYICRQWEGTPYGAEGQKIAWVSFDELASFPLPPASVEPLHKITKLLKGGL